MQLAPAEEKMWGKLPLKNRISKMTDDQINAKYESGEQRILTEMNREKLPSFVEALKKPGYMDVRPFYQRRLRWDAKMQSRLIESFLINIPVPSIILYEKDYNSYEVMDGQQRITAIRDFYELEGRTYDTLPAKIRAGIDRRSISSIVLITESTPDPEEALFLKQIAFERLNTGGVDLSRQEVRNCVYYGKFNQLLLELSSNRIFADAWGIPTDNPEELRQNNLYKKMEDAELVLRFFALRHVDDFRKGMEGFLDFYMMNSLGFSDTWKDSAYKAYYDAVMVGFSKHLADVDVLLQQKPRVIEQTKKLFREDKPKLFTGGGRTKADIQKRIRLFDNMLSQFVAE